MPAGLFKSKCFRPSDFAYRTGITGELGIAGEQYDPFDHGLGHEETIKLIFVRRWQCGLGDKALA